MDTLSRMRCFLKVVDAGGFSAAARELGRSKALVSKYVGELEDELGARLLNRTTRQISMTEVGHAFYKEASDILTPHRRPQGLDPEHASGSAWHLADLRSAVDGR